MTDFDKKRRQFLFSSLATGAALLLPELAFANQSSNNLKTAAKSVILLWLDGAPSQIDTFDPKPGRKNGGEFKAIETTVPGLLFSEHLPRLAELAKEFSVIRSLHSKEANHDRGSYLLHTGYLPQAGIIHPSTGSVISLESPNVVELPDYVNIGSLYGSSAIGRGPGFLSQKHSPFVITNSINPVQALSVLNEQTNAITSLSIQLDEQFVKQHSSRNILKRSLFYQQSLILQGSSFEKALMIHEESEELIKAYTGENSGNRSEFGMGCLAARRLVQAGVRFVEVGLGGWDTHQDNFNKTRDLCEILDPAFSALIKDLKKNGLYESTLVVCMGEFGRTPIINPANGRDHWSKNFCAVLAGGPISKGQVIGETDVDGMEIVRDPISVPDLIATIYQAVGISPAKKFRREDTRLVKYTNDGQPISNLLS